MKMKALPKSFYSRDTATVARELLGKFLVRKIGRKVVSGRIVETEAYYGSRDPASRAFKRKPLSEIMWAEPGTSFCYMVHNNWLFNIVTEQKGKPGAVLIRAIEPIEGIEFMRSRRKNKDHDLTRGPGKLTAALAISKAQHGLDVSKQGAVFIAKGKLEHFRIGSSHRIGVSRDLQRKLRFFIAGNRFVSRKA